MADGLSFRELNGISRDERWPHVDGCTGGCMGCVLEDAVLAAGGISGRDFLLGKFPAFVKKVVDEAEQVGKPEPTPKRKAPAKLARVKKAK